MRLAESSQEQDSAMAEQGSNVDITLAEQELAALLATHSSDMASGIIALTQSSNNPSDDDDDASDATGKPAGKQIVTQVLFRE